MNAFTSPRNMRSNVFKNFRTSEYTPGPRHPAERLGRRDRSAQFSGAGRKRARLARPGRIAAAKHSAPNRHSRPPPITGQASGTNERAAWVEAQAGSDKEVPFLSGSLSAARPDSDAVQSSSDNEA
ncbi:hypothetical protein ADL26_07565 [Thermoactinomyces vulgaris]|nr:hypothetical protein ADL26_07565 [Thermoactinomyces vulgaris]